MGSVLATRFRSERGAAAIEFAILLPVLVVLLFGIVEFSLVHNRQQALHAAAREGARVASVETATLSDVTNAVTGALSGIELGSEPAVEVSPDATRPCLNRVGKTVTVSVNASTTLDIPLWSTVDVSLDGEAQFRCE